MLEKAVSRSPDSALLSLSDIYVYKIKLADMKASM